MTLDATVPDGSEIASELKDYIVENRVAINALEAAVGALSAIPSYTELDMAASDDLDADDGDLYDVYFEVVKLEGSTASVDLQSIINGRSGMVKIFYVAEDVNTITFKHDYGLGAGQGTGKGDLILNGENDFAAVEHDILAFINVGGDGGASEDGVWRELFRTAWYG